MRRALALALVLIILPLSFAGGYQLGEYMAEERIRVGPSEDRAFTVKVEVYRNGKLVFVDYDDPALNNFLNVISWMFLTYNEPGVTDTSGNSLLPGTGQIQYFGQAVVGISDDTSTSFSSNLIELPGVNVLKSIVSDTSITVDTAGKSIQISGTITIPTSFTSFTVGWVGLYIDPWEDNTIDGDEILIFADPLGQNAFTAAGGDVITVVYKITVP